MTTSALIVFASTFLTVFALGLQSLNVNQGHYVAAAITSSLISTGHLWLYKVMPNPSWAELGGYYVGGIAGIVASMWFHRVVRTKWWPAIKAWWFARLDRREARRTGADEHRDVSRCGLIKTDIH